MDLAAPSSSMFRESHSLPGNPLNNLLIWTVYRAISFPTLEKESSDGLDLRGRFRKKNAVTQFIVDSGVASSGSILCTQPRKIDSISLGKRAEVEWACEKFQSTSAIALPLHGKLSHEEQSRVFQNYPGKRKLVFATNLAETSLTIPGVKYVVDSELVKHDRFESSSGMNALRVSKVSQSYTLINELAMVVEQHLGSVIGCTRILIIS
uniref:RNA helicase n=1 Tax=Populus trichocarpa TaxID=3694 RepID=A0A2K2C2N7_POPTR